MTIFITSVLVLSQLIFEKELETLNPSHPQPHVQPHLLHYTEQHEALHVI